MTSDLFAERFAEVRSRFVAKLDARIEEIESSIPALGTDIAMEALARVHRRAHDLCGVGATMGFVATGQAARKIEQVLLAALKTGRVLSADEIALVTEGVARLRAAASAEAPSAGRG